MARIKMKGVTVNKSSNNVWVSKANTIKQVLLWIFCFPIAFGKLLNDKTYLDRGKIKIATIAAWVVYIALIANFFVWYGKRGEDGNAKMVKTPMSESFAESRNYEEVIEAFKDNGFTNVSVEKIEDLVTGWITKDGSVEQVIVDGSYDFKSGDKFNSDVEVIVKYHTFPEKVEKVEEVKIEETVKEPEAIEETEETKEIEEPVHEEADMIEKTVKEPEVDETKVEEIVESDWDKLNEKLETTKCFIAIERYGKQQFPYGFTLHYITGLMDQEIWDENTWYMKIECTIKNKYGQKLDTVCEAKVSGTTDNISVEDFYVSAY